ncbi:unnamed protein product [Rhizophagus irregularis]|nr:unnamed protein product [Rhizophagus irregularis]
MIESPKHFKDIIISSNEKFAKEIEEVQVETKEDLEQHQTQEETKGSFISLLDILHPLLNNKIYNSIAAYYQEDCETISLSKIVQDTANSIDYTIGILYGYILKIKFKDLDKLDLNVHSFNYMQMI